MKRLLTKVIQKSLNALMGGASLPLNVNHAIAIEGQKVMSEPQKTPGTYTAELPKGKGKITYRLPNVIEQLRFQSAARWYDPEISQDGALRTSHAIGQIHPFVTSIEGEYKSMDEVIADRDNLDAMIMVALHIAGTRVPEAEKKQ